MTLRRQALSYHVYCGIGVDSGNPRKLAECNATDLRTLLAHTPLLPHAHLSHAVIGGSRLYDMKRMGVGGFMTEFGAVNGTQGDIDSLHFIVGAT